MASLEHSSAARLTVRPSSEHPTGPSLLAICAAGAIMVGMVVFLWIV